MYLMEEITMLSITRKEFEEMSFNKLMEKAVNECDHVHSYNDLLEFAKRCIDHKKVLSAIHVLRAVGAFNDGKYYNYDVSMGMLDTPTEIIKKSDIEQYIIFEEE